MKNKTLNRIMPIIIIAVCVAIFYVVTANPPKAQRIKPTLKPMLSVEAIQLKAQSLTINVESYGTVQQNNSSAARHL